MTAAKRKRPAPSFSLCSLLATVSVAAVVLALFYPAVTSTVVVDLKLTTATEAQVAADVIWKLLPKWALEHPDYDFDWKNLKTTVSRDQCVHISVTGPPHATAETRKIATDLADYLVKAYDQRPMRREILRQLESAYASITDDEDATSFDVKSRVLDARQELENAPIPEIISTKTFRTL